MSTLRELRLAQNLSQTKLCKLLGVAPLTYFNWEHGCINPTPVNYNKLVAFFGVVPSDITMSTKL